MVDRAIEDILASYPRVRPPLTPGHKKIYVEEYKLNRGGEGLLYKTTQRLESWMHKIIASRGGRGSILELGGGSLNHVPYENPEARYDCVEPFKALCENSPFHNRIKHMYADLDDLSPDSHYDRVVSIAVLEHLVDLPGMIAQSALLMADGGIFQGSIPTEGGFLWGMAWRLTTGVSYRMRTGLDYGTVMGHEHLNSAREIQAITEYFFRDVEVRRFPTPLFHFSFYTYLEARFPDIERCSDYLKLAEARQTTS